MHDFGGLDYVVRDALLAIGRRYADSPAFYSYERDIVVDICRELAARCPELLIEREQNGVRTGLLKTEWTDGKNRTDILIIDPRSLGKVKKDIEAYPLVEIEVKHQGWGFDDLAADLDVLAKSHDETVLSVAFSLHKPEDEKKWRRVLQYANTVSRYDTLCAFSNLGATGLLGRLGMGPQTLTPSTWLDPRPLPVSAGSAKRRRPPQDEAIKQVRPRKASPT